MLERLAAFSHGQTMDSTKHIHWKRLTSSKTFLCQLKLWLARKMLLATLSSVA
jgi:hypothetical protein